ncbi:MAG: site-specific DNA-methyltransferase, partial [Hyphomicrobiaceae bacterium]|nr:site-specific DNA-methyltransferase [Hyphomicrobiaceae bacterium]
MTELRDLILDLLPDDGAAVGNQSLLARLRQTAPDLTDAAYAATRDALVADGLLVKGRGRGGSVALVVEVDDEDEKDDDEGENEDGFELTSPEEPAPRGRRSAPAKKRRAKPDGPVQVISYRHTDTRVNNPEVG